MSNQSDQIEHDVAAARQPKQRSSDNSGVDASIDAVEAISFQLVEIEDQVRRVGSILQWLIVVLIVSIFIFMIFLANTAFTMTI